MSDSLEIQIIPQYKQGNNQKDQIYQYFQVSNIPSNILQMQLLKDVETQKSIDKFYEQLFNLISKDENLQPLDEFEDHKKEDNIDNTFFILGFYSTWELSKLYSGLNCLYRSGQSLTTNSINLSQRIQKDSNLVLRIIKQYTQGKSKSIKEGDFIILHIFAPKDKQQKQFSMKQEPSKYLPPSQSSGIPSMKIQIKGDQNVLFNIPTKKENQTKEFYPKIKLQNSSNKQQNLFYDSNLFDNQSRKELLQEDEEYLNSNTCNLSSKDFTSMSQYKFQYTKDQFKEQKATPQITSQESFESFDHYPNKKFKVLLTQNEQKPQQVLIGMKKTFNSIFQQSQSYCFDQHPQPMTKNETENDKIVKECSELKEEQLYQKGKLIQYQQNKGVFSEQEQKQTKQIPSLSKIFEQNQGREQKNLKDQTADNPIQQSKLLEDLLQKYNGKDQILNSHNYGLRQQKSYNYKNFEITSKQLPIKKQMKYTTDEESCNIYDNNISNEINYSDQSDGNSEPEEESKQIYPTKSQLKQQLNFKNINNKKNSLYAFDNEQMLDNKGPANMMIEENQLNTNHNSYKQNNKLINEIKLEDNNQIHSSIKNQQIKNLENVQLQTQKRILESQRQECLSIIDEYTVKLESLEYKHRDLEEKFKQSQSSNKSQQIKALENQIFLENKYLLDSQRSEFSSKINAQNSKLQLLKYKQTDLDQKLLISSSPKKEGKNNGNSLLVLD